MDVVERVEKGLYDRVVVEDESGEEVEVFGSVRVTVSKEVHFRAGSFDEFLGRVEIEAGDGGIGEPDAVAPFLAESIQHELGIDVEDHGIRDRKSVV